MIKDLKKDIEGLEVKIKEEQSQKKRVTNSVSQKENKITVLSNKLNEITTLNKEQEKKIKEYEKKIEEYESSGKVVKAQPKPAKNQKKSSGPRLFGANDEDIPLAQPPPARKVEQSKKQTSSHKPDDEDIPTSKFLLGDSESPVRRFEENKNDRQVRFSEKLNMHENSSNSSLEEMQPVKAQPFLFGPDDNDDMQDMNYPSDSHMKKEF